MFPFFKTSKKIFLYVHFLSGIRIRKKRSNVKKREIRFDKRYEEYIKFFENKIFDTNERSTSNPIVLLKRNEYESIKENAIVVQNMKLVNKDSLQRVVEYGIESIGSKLHIIETKKGLVINLQQTSGRYFYILAHCKQIDCLQNKVSIYSTDGCTAGKDINTDHSDYIVLSYGIQHTYNNAKQKKFEENDLKIIKQIANNQVKPKNFHFDTKGQIYSFGYAPKYCKLKADGISFRKFQSRKQSMFSEITQKHFIKHYENLLSEEIVYSIEQMRRYFPNVKKILSPTISILQSHFDMFDSQEKKKRMEKFIELGLSNLHYCVNAETEKFHTEQDQSYTVITVPQQHDMNWKKGNGANFEFYINSETTIFLQMIPNTSFMYSGYLLTHRQQLSSTKKQKSSFINIATYCSKRLFNNMSKSLERHFS